MLVASIARVLAARGVHYGWLIVALAFGYDVCSEAAFAIPSVLLTPITKEFGWSIADLSGPLGLRVTLFGLVAPFAGGLMLRYGPRAVVAASATLLIGGMLLTMNMTAKWQLWLGLGVVMGVAPGMTSLVLATTISARWFTARQGLVLGVLSAATATGQLIFLPQAAWLAGHFGWRAALLPPMALVAVLGALFALLARNHPADLNLPPFGENTVAPVSVPAPGNAVALSFAALRDGARTRVFWVLAFTYGVCGLSSYGLMPHFVSLCGDFGITPLTSTSLMALMGVCDFVGTIGSGWLSDRYDSRWLLAWYYGLRGLALIWLPYSGFSLIGLSAFAVFYGLDFIATVPPSVRLAVGAFGEERAPVVFGWIFAAHQLGAGVMAFGAGVTRDALASYLPAFFAAGVLCLAAVASLALLRNRRGPAMAAT